MCQSVQRGWLAVWMGIPLITKMPLINDVAVERCVLQSLRTANGQDLSSSAWSERGEVIDFCRESGYVGVVYFRLCRLLEGHKLCALMIHFCTKKTCSLASQCKLVYLKCTKQSPANVVLLSKPWSIDVCNKFGTLRANASSDKWIFL